MPGLHPQQKIIVGTRLTMNSDESLLHELRLISSALKKKLDMIHQRGSAP